MSLELVIIVLSVIRFGAQCFDQFQAVTKASVSHFTWLNGSRCFVDRLEI